MRHLKLTAAMAAVALVACGPQKVEPTLAIIPSPRTIDGEGQISTVRVTATDDVGAPGTGNVNIVSNHGSLVDGTDVSLANGEGTFEFSCDRATDPECSGTVRLTAKWNGLTINTNVTVRPPHVPDAGLTLQATPTSIALGLQQISDLVATYYLDGIAAPGATINLTTTGGTLQLPDGGPWQQTAADATGEVHARLVATGNPGTATITATASDGKTASTNVTLYLPDAGLDIDQDFSVLTVGFNQRARLTITHHVGAQAVPNLPIEVTATRGALRLPDGGPFNPPAYTDNAGQVELLLAEEVGVTLPGNALITARDTTFNTVATTNILFAQPDAGITVMAARSPIYVGVGDSSEITALYTTNGVPAGGQSLNLSSTLGELQWPDGGTFSNPLTTASDGTVKLRLVPTGTAGLATVTATDPASGRFGSTNVSIRTIQQVVFYSMECPNSTVATGQVCIMGIAGSGFNTTATLHFRVTDNTNAPVANTPVTFSTSTAATTISVPPGPFFTDATGDVSVQVTSGVNTGTFSVVAQAAGQNAPSPTIGVRGAKPTSTGINMTCSPVNLAAYRAPTFPLSLPSNCEVTLTDRRNNRVGTGKVVEFAIEAGNIGASLPTTAYNTAAGANNDNEGKVVANFNTAGAPQRDVAPLAADPAQYPVPLVAEPSRVVGQETRNPRDGLVTIVVFTDGEEAYTDTNLNGQYDPGEPFVDISEPFVDANDNDIFDGEDIPIASGDVNQNAQWDGPNGVWDANTKVWRKAWVLYTDAAAVTSLSQNGFTMAKGTQTTVDVFARDQNLNIMESASTLPFGSMSPRGSGTFVGITTGGFLDGFGFEPTFVVLNSTGTGPCGTTPGSICTYRTRFSTWWDGYIGTWTLTAPPVTDMGGPTNSTFTVTPTTRALGPPIPLSVTMQ